MGAIQIKNVPEELHQAIRSRAAQKGKTVSDYMLDLAKRDLSKPTVQEWVAMVRAGWGPEPTHSDVDTADIIRRDWKEREDQILRAMGYDSLPDPDDDQG
jgi:antitoxin FitA